MAHRSPLLPHPPLQDPAHGGLRRPAELPALHDQKQETEARERAGVLWATCMVSVLGFLGHA